MEDFVASFKHCDVPVLQYRCILQRCETNDCVRAPCLLFLM